MRSVLQEVNVRNLQFLHPIRSNQTTLQTKCDSKSHLNRLMKPTERQTSLSVKRLVTNALSQTIRDCLSQMCRQGEQEKVCATSKCYVPHARGYILQEPQDQKLQKVKTAEDARRLDHFFSLHAESFHSLRLHLDVLEDLRSSLQRHIQRDACIFACSYCGR